MGNKILKEIEEYIAQGIYFYFNIFVGLIQAVIILIAVMGATASIVLLVQLYPAIALKVINPFYNILTLFWEIIKILFWLILGGIIIIIGFKSWEGFKKSKIRSKKRRAEWIQKLAVEIYNHVEVIRAKKIPRRKKDAR